MQFPFPNPQRLTGEGRYPETTGGAPPPQARSANPFALSLSKPVLRALERGRRHAIPFP